MIVLADVRKNWKPWSLVVMGVLTLVLSWQTAIHAPAAKARPKTYGATGGTGVGPAQDATGQAINAKEGITPIPCGGTGVGPLQDSTMQCLLNALPDGGGCSICLPSPTNGAILEAPVAEPLVWTPVGPGPQGSVWTSNGPGFTPGYQALQLGQLPAGSPGQQLATTADGGVSWEPHAQGVDVLTFGADPTGATDSATAFGNAQAYAIANGLAMYLPSAPDGGVAAYQIGSGYTLDARLRGGWVAPGTTLTGAGSAQWQQVELLGVAPGVLQTAWAFDPINATGCATDTNNCTQSTCGGTGVGPCQSWQQIAQRIGKDPTYPCGQSVAVTQLSAQVPCADAGANCDVIFFEPRMSCGGQATLTVNPTLYATVDAGTVTAESRGAPGTLLQVAGMPAGTTKNMLVVDTAKNSQAIIDSVSGTTATMQQPQTTASLTSTAVVPAPVEDNTWASGDPMSVYTLNNCNLKQWRPIGGDETAALKPTGAWIFYPSIADLSGSGGSVLILENGAAVTALVNGVINGRTDVWGGGGRGTGLGSYLIGCSGTSLLVGTSPLAVYGGGWAGGAEFSGSVRQAGTLANDVIVHSTLALSNVGDWTVVNVYSDGTIQVQGLANVTGFVWGSYTASVLVGGFWQNNTGSTFALKALLTSGAIRLNQTTTGYSFTAATGAWGTGTALTASAIDSAPGASLYAQGGAGGFVTFGF